MKRALQLASVLAGAIGGVLLYRFPPERYAIYPACPFHALTGWLCPGCGSTRALSALLHGEWLRAFAFNPLLALLPPVFWLLWRYRERVAQHQAVVGYAVGTSLLAWTVARNLFHL
jgi:hypothetical protein